MNKVGYIILHTPSSMKRYQVNYVEYLKPIKISILAESVPTPLYTFPFFKAPMGSGEIGVGVPLGEII